MCQIKLVGVAMSVLIRPGYPVQRCMSGLLAALVLQLKGMAAACVMCCRKGWILALQLCSLQQATCCSSLNTASLSNTELRVFIVGHLQALDNLVNQ